MFNHYFFRGRQDAYKKFLSHSTCDEIILVTDPPFGGLVAVIAHTIRRIMADWAQDPDGMLWLKTIIFCIDYSLKKLQTIDTFVSMHKYILVYLYINLFLSFCIYMFQVRGFAKLNKSQKSKKNWIELTPPIHPPSKLFFGYPSLTWTEHSNHIHQQLKAKI